MSAPKEIGLPALLSAIATIAILAMLPDATAAEPTEHGTHAKKEQDEPFAATSHRRFDDVEYWSGVFDDPERDAWQKPDAIVASLKLAPGDCVADLGAGTGYLMSRIARAVGEGGCVYAVEVEPNLVAHLLKRAESEELANVTPVLASKDNPRLPQQGVDLVFILDTYHHLDARDRYIPLLKRSLSDRGRIAIIDWKKKELPVGPPMGHKLARDTVVAEMTAAGFLLSQELDILDNQYFLIFSPKR